MDNEWKWQQENAELRKALEFYASPKSYALEKYNGVRFVTKVEVDRGAVAKKVLEELNYESIN